ncbi:Oidioi.mRNA.OKI2018_I69.chr2.g5473.t1.cds [Oikopleura dioica]|uniref:Oidioi.mRNA.OKI2018_I69.chr2.g5473.t1.cds n=1 Tax=Oikopleura dioica TaxID=34765 RepID=A0ABN7T4R5_OIKDI|nr:Oidioi.mRNA.OKI2018_I69.chr2.g5473.t1.cds [Oikopleura dioica]
MNSEIYKPGETAIVVVDVQAPFYSGFPGIPESFPDFPDSIRRFLSAAREKGFRICHLNQESLSGKDKWLDNWYRKNGNDWSCDIVAGNIEEFAAPAAGEPIFVKHDFDGFSCPQFPAYLERHGIKSLIIVGLLATICVHYTAISAYMRGFPTAIIDECVADRSKEKFEALKTLTGHLFDFVKLDEFLSVQT